jgi:hypothetical protein
MRVAADRSAGRQRCACASDMRADQAGNELLAVARIALLGDGLAFGLQRLGAGERAAGHARERQLRDQCVALRARQMGQKKLAAGGAVQGHVRAHIEREPQRPLGLDAVDVEHLAAVQRGEVAGLADLRDQRGQHLMPQAAHHAVVQRVECQLAQRGTDGVAALIGVAREKAAVLKLRAQPVRGGLGQAQPHRQLGQRQRMPFIGQHRQQAQAALGRRSGRGHGVRSGGGRLAAWHRENLENRNIVFRNQRP